MFKLTSDILFLQPLVTTKSQELRSVNKYIFTYPRGDITKLLRIDPEELCGMFATEINGFLFVMYKLDIQEFQKHWFLRYDTRNGECIRYFSQNLSIITTCKLLIEQFFFNYFEMIIKFNSNIEYIIDL